MDDWEKAGKIAQEALIFGKNLIKIDESLLEITEKIEKKIKALGGNCAFPINISINEIAAHYSAFPNDQIKFEQGDLVKLDIGIHVNGAIGDTALTIDLGNNKDLVKASENALKAALKLAKPGIRLFEMGEAIESEIENLGFKPVKNLSGHQIEEYNLHAGLTIPNYNNKDESELEENMIIAIEPFATDGSGFIFEGKKSGIYKLEQIKNVRDMKARELIKFIDENYKLLPFSRRWINIPMRDVRLNILERENIIVQYPQLVERGKGMVSQAEHTIRIGNKILT